MRIGGNKLSPRRIEQFEQFQADESFVDDQCVICMEDVEIGRNMMRRLRNKLIKIIESNFNYTHSKQMR